MASWTDISFHRRLFVGLLIYSWLLVACFAGFQYYRERQFKAAELNAQLQIVNSRLLHDIDACDTLRIPSYAGQHPFSDMRVSVIDTAGHVLYDNSLDRLPNTNHLDRSEIADAMRHGEGFSLRRHSDSTGETYFYSAKRGHRYIVRTAVPYSVTLQELLAADYGFLWFTVGITLLMSVLGYFATRRIGTHISRLNRFAEAAERGDRIYDTEPFPHDELGDISNHIVRLYARLQQTEADLKREHRAALHEQQEKVRIKKQLTNNINHELKTPVAAMQVCLETLEAHPDLPEEKRSEFLNRCSAACDRLRRLLTDVAQITRLDEGGSAIAMEEVNLRDTVAEVCDEFAPAAEAKGFTIANGIAYSGSLHGSQSLLASVFRNLIDNALNYSGGDRIELKEINSAGSEVVISVSDNGNGIAEEHLPRLFERFYRIDKGRSRRAGGTGLGLSIVRNAVLLHGGEIRVENLRSGGLRFTFSLKKQPPQTNGSQSA